MIGYHRVLRVARTLADLDGAEKITRLHLAEALSYCGLADRRCAACGIRCRLTAMVLTPHPKGVICPSCQFAAGRHP
jgi:hypothetical protein